jgi:hypothetical protein
MVPIDKKDRQISDTASGILKVRHPQTGVKQTGDKSPEQTGGTFGATVSTVR